MSAHDQPNSGQPAFEPPATGAQLQPGGVFVFTRPGRLDNEQSLRSYLLIRALGRSVINTVQWSGIVILALAAVFWLSGLKVLGILVGLLAVAVLLVRFGLGAVAQRFSRSPAGPQLDRLVARTGRGLRKELRRVGLPGTPGAPLLIALRLIRRHRRAQTLQALGRIELANIVPSSQVDELHLLLQAPPR